MKEIDIDECHNILLNLASAFDYICRKHHIPYYMLGGTMLGAIRHKGFIPWDDDMDFGVERQYFSKLTEVLSKELPTHIKMKTLDNSDNIFSYFIKIEDIRTEVVDDWHDSVMGIGICIDIFPLDKGRINYHQTKLFASYIYFLLMIKDYLHFDPKYRRGLKKYIAIILRKTNLISIKKRLKYIDNLIIKYTKKESDYWVNYYGRYRKKEIIHNKIFGKPKEYTFEDIKLTGVDDTDTYLSTLYGDYMQIPPKEMRTSHINVMRYK